MEVEILKVQKKCEKCEKNAKFCLKIRKKFHTDRILICEKCLNEEYKKMGKLLIPQSPTNILKGENKEKYEI